MGIYRRRTIVLARTEWRKWQQIRGHLRLVRDLRQLRLTVAVTAVVRGLQLALRLVAVALGTEPRIQDLLLCTAGGH